MKGFFKKKKNRKLVTVIIVLLVVVAAGWALMNRIGNQNDETATSYTMFDAEKRSISVFLTGTGTLQPADSYTVMTLNSGDVLSAPFEEGDVVEKNRLLYEIDSSDVASNLESSAISLSDSQRNYEMALEGLENLDIKSKQQGTLTLMNVEVGDTVQAGQTVATIRDSSVMTLEVPFIMDEANGLKVGQTADVLVDGTFETLTGKVTKISAISNVLTGGVMTKNVTIEVTNPGGLTPMMSGTAKVGSVQSYDGGSFAYLEESVVVAFTSGEVSEVRFKEGDFVAKDAILVTLESSAVEEQIESAKSALRKTEISYESQKDALNGYVIESPISGTVIEKNFKQGDTLESGQKLCVIFDLSYLKMTLNIDELDISKVSVGQKVQVVAAAVDGKVYEGVVTKVNINGMTSGGSTTYPVTIRIDETDGLLPGMNVDAEILLESKENVLSIPSSAVKRGNQVLVKRGADAEPSVDGTALDIPEGFRWVTVVTGISDANFIEIVEGLVEGDVVAVEKRVMSNDMFMFEGPRDNGNIEEGEVEAP